MPLTVSMPTFNTPASLLKVAVESVVQSLPAGGRLIVVNDGGKEPNLPKHPAVSVWNLGRNMGRYAADAVVLAGLDDNDLWCPHDSDDWSQPGRFVRMVADAAQTGVVVAPFVRHDHNRPAVVQQPNRRALDGASQKHVSHWCAGMYRVDRVRQAGGLWPGMRTSWDNTLLAIMVRQGRTVWDRHAAYHWHRRFGSLTTNAETKIGSVFRTEERLKAKKVWTDFVAGGDPAVMVASMTEARVAADVERLAKRFC